MRTLRWRMRAALLLALFACARHPRTAPMAAQIDPACAGYDGIRLRMTEAEARARTPELHLVEPGAYGRTLLDGRGFLAVHVADGRVATIGLLFSDGASYESFRTALRDSCGQGVERRLLPGQPDVRGVVLQHLERVSTWDLPTSMVFLVGDDTQVSQLLFADRALGAERIAAIQAIADRLDGKAP